MSQIKMEFVGNDQLKARMAQFSEKKQSNIKRAIAVGAVWIQKDAVDSLDTSSKTGREYHLTRPTRVHQASAPGEAPSSDTGVLRSGVVIVLDPEGFGANVVSKAPYSSDLEYGTKKMAARPFMMPAFVKNKSDIVANLKQALAS